MEQSPGEAYSFSVSQEIPGCALKMVVSCDPLERNFAEADTRSASQCPRLLRC